ncbi:Putative tRNA-dihydrouridine synthase [Aspergillus calidoustus]|uniref:tRNA-dihydrouridine(16/17) synthase [NAD(P)(+)] n=1 Tax=Aspergillus calidoustus TaxID=454130 RepID=A0A0U5GX39_ASPCI|nr:Putative tRNA-dihydrouridine synthase [Aspergillus calidoustus]
MAVSESIPAPSNSSAVQDAPKPEPVPGKKLHGREFYKSIGSPKYIVAPMVDRSEFAWRMLTRSFMPPEESKLLLAYSPMFHARLFREEAGYRAKMFQPTRAHAGRKGDDSIYLDGNPAIDRPFFVQFCANNPDDFLESARLAAPYCDAVDLNLGCPQGIARKGHYGAFLQEDWDLIYRLINRLHKELPIPVTAKFRIQESKEKTLEYAKMILSAGASIITLHGRTREQKGHNTGLADWSYIRYLRDHLPPETVIFANGNNLNYDDVQRCLEATGADGVMSAEGNLSDPSIFSKPPPVGSEGREYWRGRDGKGGYRIDAVFRRYLDIIYKYVLEKPAPERKPLYLPSDPEEEHITESDPDEEEGPQRKKQKRGKTETYPNSPNLKFMQAHLFQLFRPLISTHTNVRDALAKSGPHDMATFERTLSILEREVKKGLKEYEQFPERFESKPDPSLTGSKAIIAEYGRPFWVCQPHIRPTPEEALEAGALQEKKGEKKKKQENGEALDKVATSVKSPTESVNTPTTAAKDALLSG